MPPQRRRTQRHAGEHDGALFRRPFHRRSRGVIGPGPEYALRVLTIPMDGATVSPRLRHFLPNLCCGFAASKVSAMFWSCKRPEYDHHTTFGRILPRQLRAQGDGSRPPRRRSNADIHPTAAVDARTSAAGQGFRTPAARRALPGSPSVAKVVALSNSDYHLSANGFRLHSLETRPTPS